MEWPDYISYTSLFPSFLSEKTVNSPSFDGHSPVWNILNPESTNSLKKQLAQLVQNLSAMETANRANITIDETKGRVIIDSNEG